MSNHGTTYGEIVEPDDPDDPDVKRIADLYVGCSYPVLPYHGPLCASDTCRALAESGVEMPNGNLMWRCRAHRGLRQGTEPGTVREYVILRSS